MAHPTSDLRILASPDSRTSADSSLKKQNKAPPVSSASSNNSAPSKVDLIKLKPSKSTHSSNPIPVSKLYTHGGLTSQRLKNSGPVPALKDRHLQAKSLTVSAMVDSSKFHVVKSKPKPKRIDSCCNEKSSKPCKELDGNGKKFYDEKKEPDEGVVGRKSLSSMVKDKELKELQEGHRFYSSRPTVSLSLRGGRRRSFGGSELELADIFANSGVKVVSVDMPPSMQIHAVDCARSTHDSMEKFTSKTLALTLKREFDGTYGPAWHCIVGTSFGSFVTHSVGGFLYFSMDQKLYILLFKTTVQRAA